MKTLLNSVTVIIGMFFGLLAYMFAYAHRKKVVYHSFSVQEGPLLGKELSVFFISDIHRRRIDKRLLKKAESYGPVDIVIIGGDLAERGVPLLRIKRNVKMLSTLGPLFFVWGNNDREIGEDAIRDLLSQRGCTILDNMNTPIKTHPLWGICGTDDPSSNNVDVEASLKDVDTYRYLIVVTHTPSLFRKVEAVCRPELMLAGHMHGGQIRIGKFALHPLGQFNVSEGKAKLISNGYGTSLVPLRLGAAPESHIIKIKY